MREVSQESNLSVLKGTFCSDGGFSVFYSNKQFSKHKMRNFLVAILLILVGCARTGVAITQDNNEIDMPHYSIELPANQGWMITEFNKNEESLYLTKRMNSCYYTMLFTRNWIADESMKSWTAKQIADSYREGEEMNMIMQGVMTGQYELKDVVKGEEMLGESRFYTMEYTTVKDNFLQKAYLFLYFPKEKQVDDFIVSHYSETIFEKASSSVSLKQEFIDTLKKMRTKQ